MTLKMPLSSYRCDDNGNGAGNGGGGVMWCGDGRSVCITSCSLGSPTAAG